MPKFTKLARSFSEEDLTVYYQGKPVTVLNDRLAAKQGVTKDQLEELKRLHTERIDIEYKLQSCRLEERKILIHLWYENQLLLQKTWGFPEDVRFHRFWEMMGCDCPKMDNNDRYPTGFYVINQACHIHGDS